MEKNYIIFKFDYTWLEGLTENGTSYYRMYREMPTNEVINNEVVEFISKLTEKNREGIVVTVVQKGYDTWCLGWFNHWTFDTGQSDSDALRSFSAYVERNRHNEGLLMGAEDRERWCAGEYEDTEDADMHKKPPPCRCETCKKRGVITINH